MTMFSPTLYFEVYRDGTAWVREWENDERDTEYGEVVRVSEDGKYLVLKFGTRNVYRGAGIIDTRKAYYVVLEIVDTELVGGYAMCIARCKARIVDRFNVRMSRMEGGDIREALAKAKATA